MKNINYTRIQPCATLDLDNFTLYSLIAMWDNIRKAMRIPKNAPSNILDIENATVVRLKYHEGQMLRNIDMLIHTQNYYVYGYFIEEVGSAAQMAQGSVNYQCYDMKEIHYGNINGIPLASVTFADRVKGLWNDLMNKTFICSSGKSIQFYYFVFILSECAKSKPCQWGLLYSLDLIERQQGIRIPDSLPDFTITVKTFYKGDPKDLEDYNNYHVFFNNWEKSMEHSIKTGRRLSYNDLCEYDDYVKYLKSIDENTEFNSSSEKLIKNQLTK